MTWNYRLVKHSTYVAIHEVYYNESGRPSSVTAEPIGLLGADAEEIKEDLEYIMRAFDAPVLAWEDIVNED